jgi:hypothetical protein
MSSGDFAFCRKRAGFEGERGHPSSATGRASRAERSEECRRRTSSWPNPPPLRLRLAIARLRRDTVRRSRAWVGFDYFPVEKYSWPNSTLFFLCALPPVPRNGNAMHTLGAFF